MTEATPLKPTWTSVPGDTIADLIEERGWSQSELVDRLGFTKKHVSKLVNGDVAITAESAQKFYPHDSGFVGRG